MSENRWYEMDYGEALAGREHNRAIRIYERAYASPPSHLASLPRTSRHSRALYATSISWNSASPPGAAWCVMDSLRAFALTTTNPGPSSRKNVNSSGSLVAFSIALTVLPAPLVTYLVVLGASPGRRRHRRRRDVLQPVRVPVEVRRRAEPLDELPHARQRGLRPAVRLVRHNRVVADHHPPRRVRRPQTRLQPLQRLRLPRVPAPAVRREEGHQARVVRFPGRGRGTSGSTAWCRRSTRPARAEKTGALLLPPPRSRSRPRGPTRGTRSPSRPIRVARSGARPPARRRSGGSPCCRRRRATSARRARVA